MDEPSDEITEDGPTQNSAKQQKKNVHFVETPNDQIDDEFNDEQATSSQHDTQAKRTAKRVLTSDEESDESTDEVFLWNLHEKSTPRPPKTLLDLIHRLSM